MKNTFTTLLFLLCLTASKAQSTNVEEGYYRTSSDFKSNNLLQVGELISANGTDLVFKFLYSKVYYNTKNVWGYRDKDGKDYRSIEGKFFQVVLAKKICVFQLTENNETIYRISYEAGGFPLEMNTDNVLKLLSGNQILATQYKSLGGRDKKEKAIEFIKRYNDSPQM